MNFSKKFVFDIFDFYGFVSVRKDKLDQQTKKIFFIRNLAKLFFNKTENPFLFEISNLDTIWRRRWRWRPTTRSYARAGCSYPCSHARQFPFRAGRHASRGYWLILFESKSEYSLWIGFFGENWIFESFSN